MSKKVKTLAVLVVASIAIGSVFYLSGGDLMGKIRLTNKKAYDENRNKNYQESIEKSTCNDKKDNDNDGLIDYGKDPDCKYLWDDEDEYNPPPRTPEPEEPAPEEPAPEEPAPEPEEPAPEEPAPEPEEPAPEEPAPEEPAPEEPAPEEPAPISSEYTVTFSSYAVGSLPIAVGGTDATLLGITIESNADVIVKNLPIKISVTPESSAPAGLLNENESNFTDIKYYDMVTSITVAGPIDSSELNTSISGNTKISEETDTTGYYSFADEIEVFENQGKILFLSVDVSNNPSLNLSQITAEIDPLGSQMTIELQKSGEVLNNQAVVKVEGSLKNQKPIL